MIGWKISAVSLGKFLMGFLGELAWDGKSYKILPDQSIQTLQKLCSLMAKKSLFQAAFFGMTTASEGKI